MSNVEDKIEPIVCDMVVAGGGLGGVSAAVVAAERGRSVVLVEAGHQLGGTAIYSGGGVHVWGVKSWEEYRRRCPQAHPVLGKRLIDRFDDYARWVVSTGAPGSYGTTSNRGLALLKYQIGNSALPRPKIRFFEHMKKRLVRLGGRVLVDTRAKRLLVTDGKVAGLTAQCSGSEVSIRAGAVVLATGGFQNSARLLSEHIGPAATAFVKRAVDEDVGDGLEMAVAVGAALSPNMDTLYGHLMPAPPCVLDWTNYLDPLLLSAFYAEHGVVVNDRGERFVDEGDGELTGLTINAAAKQPAGGLWILLDSEIRRKFARYEVPQGALRPGGLRHLRFLKYLGLRRESGRVATVVDSLRLARDRGATIVQAPTVEGLVQGLAAHVVDPNSLRKTVREFNASVNEGAALGLDIPKTKHAYAISRPPFYAIKVAVGVSMTYGGLAINEYAQVLGQDGAPIEGLYAVPGTAGGIQNLHYGGALAACGVYGMIAGESCSA